MATVTTFQAEDIMGPGFLVLFRRNFRKVDDEAQFYTAGDNASMFATAGAAESEMYTAGAVASQMYTAGVVAIGDNS